MDQMEILQKSNTTPFRIRSNLLSIRQLEATLRAVIKTASCTRLSESHAATVCDTLRACLARCEDSGDPDLFALAYSQETWTEIFDIFLRSSESRKPKPLKLLLLALERNLVKNPSQSVKDHLIAHIISRTWQVISLKDDGDSAVKPSLQALRHFICKRVIRAQDIILITSQNSAAKDAEGTKPLEAQSALSPMGSSWAPKYMEHSHSFLCKTLSWVRHPDVAPITGRLIGVFCASLRAWSSTWENPAGLAKSSHGNQPIWFSALKSSIQAQPELLDLFAIHVFPEIVSQDRDGIADFAEVLSLKHLEVGNFIAYGSADLHISLLLLRAIKEKGTFDTIGRSILPMFSFCGLWPQPVNVQYRLTQRVQTMRLSRIQLATYSFMPIHRSGFLLSPLLYSPRHLKFHSHQRYSPLC